MADFTRTFDELSEKERKRYGDISGYRDAREEATGVRRKSQLQDSGKPKIEYYDHTTGGRNERFDKGDIKELRAQGYADDVIKKHIEKTVDRGDIKGGAQAMVGAFGGNNYDLDSYDSNTMGNRKYHATGVASGKDYSKADAKYLYKFGKHSAFDIKEHILRSGKTYNDKAMRWLDKKIEQDRVPIPEREVVDAGIEDIYKTPDTLRTPSTPYQNDPIYEPPVTEDVDTPGSVYEPVTPDPDSETPASDYALDLVANTPHGTGIATDTGLGGKAWVDYWTEAGKSGDQTAYLNDFIQRSRDASGYQRIDTQALRNNNARMTQFYRDSAYLDGFHIFGDIYNPNRRAPDFTNPVFDPIEEVDYSEIADDYMDRFK